MNVVGRSIVWATALIAGLVVGLTSLHAQTPAPSPAPDTSIYLPLIDRGHLGTPVYLPLIDQNRPTPTPTSPQATVKFARINLRPQPSTLVPPNGQAIRDTVCAILERDVETDWLLLDCGRGVPGWVNAQLVDIGGNLREVPIRATAVPATSAARPAAATPTPTAPPVPTPTPSLWRADFYDGPFLSEPPVFTRWVSDIDFDWGTSSPSENLAPNRFSIRFTRSMDFAAGYYRFVMRADDGVRFWLDDELLVDGWLNGRGDTFSVTRWLDGPVDLRLDYYEDRIDASVRFLVQAQPNTANWRVTYYDGLRLTGAPLLTRFEPRGYYPLDFAWGRSSPAPGEVPANGWSARWRGRFAFDGGNYVFYSDSEDGVRVYINNLMVIDNWRSGESRAQNRLLGLGSGTHEITVEYFHRSSDGHLKVWWERAIGSQLDE